MFDSSWNIPGRWFGELERLQRQFDDAFGATARVESIRSGAPGTYPALNVGTTPKSVEVYAFAPGLEADKFNVTLERGVLVLSGERPSTLPESSERRYVHSKERPSGRFRRTLSLPDDIDPQKVEARYRDGLLHVSIARREEAQPRRISVN